MKTRYLTVTCLYPSRTGDGCMPMICMYGNWLEKAGFIIGEDVSVEVTRKGEIVIRILDVAGAGLAEKQIDLSCTN